MLIRENFPDPAICLSLTCLGKNGFLCKYWKVDYWNYYFLGHKEFLLCDNPLWKLYLKNHLSHIATSHQNLENQQYLDVMSRAHWTAGNSHSSYKTYFFELSQLSGSQPRTLVLCFSTSNKESLNESHTKKRGCSEVSGSRDLLWGTHLSITSKMP